MARQAGMTLIELTVVLLVLIGLAGLMIPYVGGFVSKTHDATGSDSLAAVNGAVQRYDVQFLGQPSGYDSLMSSITATTGTVYNKLMNGDGSGTLDAEDYIQAVNIPASALTGVGIDSLMLMDDTTADATFASTASSIAMPASGMIRLLALNTQAGVACSASAPMGCISSDADLSAILGHSADTNAKDYIIFGVGQDSTMVGKTISEAPVHFAKTGAMSAANKYNRILAVYEVPKADYCDGGTLAVTGTFAATQADCEIVDATHTVMTAVGTWETVGMMDRRAKFVTTAMPMMILEGLGGALASHYSSVDN